MDEFYPNVLDDFQIHFLDSMRKLRSDIQYRGRDVADDYLKRNSSTGKERQKKRIPFDERNHIRTGNHRNAPNRRGGENRSVWVEKTKNHFKVREVEVVGELQCFPYSCSIQNR